MKKLLSLLLLVLTSLFTVSKTYAVMPNNIQWDNYNYYSNYYAMHLEYNFEAPILYFDFTIPETDYNTFENAGLFSQVITFTGINKTGTSTTYLLSSKSFIINNQYIFVLDDPIQSVDIKIVQTYSALPSQYVSYFNIYSSFNFQISRVLFYTGVTLYESQYFYGIPNRPDNPTPPENYEFLGWQTLDGTFYDFTWISPHQLDDNGDYRLFAKYRNVYDIDVGITDPNLNIPSNIQTILQYLGLFNTVGFMILFIVIIMLVTVGLWLLKSPLFVYMIIYILITALFIFMGLFTVFAYIVLGLMLLLGLIMTFKMGGAV